MYNIAGQGLVLLITFAAIKAAFSKLGADALGIIYFTQAMSVTLTSALDLGLGSTTVREIAALSAQGSRGVTEFVRTASLFYWCLYLALALSIYLVAPFIVARWITLDTLAPDTATSAVRILGAGGLLALPKSLYASVMRGVERMEFNNSIDVVMALVQQGGTVALILTGGSLVKVAWYQSAALGAGIVAYLVLTARFVPYQALVPAVYREVIARNYRYCSRAAAISLFGTVHQQADKVITSRVLPIALFGYYTVAWGLASRVTLITGAIGQAAFPSMTALFNVGAHDNLSKRYWKLNDIICYGMVPLFMIIPFAAGPLFSLLLQPSAAAVLLLPSALLSLGFYLNSTLLAPHVLSLATNRPGITARLNAYAVCITLPLAVLLVKAYGMNGAALSWVAYNSFGWAYGVPRVCRECLNTSPWTWYARMLKVALLTTLTYGTAGLILRITGKASLTGLATSYAAATVGFGLGAYALIGYDLRSDISSTGRQVGVWLHRRLLVQS